METEQKRNLRSEEILAFILAKGIIISIIIIPFVWIIQHMPNIFGLIMAIVVLFGAKILNKKAFEPLFFFWLSQLRRRNAI